MIAVGVAIVAALFLLVVYDGWSQIHDVNAQIEQKREESKGLDKLVKRAQEKRQVAETIGKWTANEIVWLDELRDLSLRFPSQRDAVILRLGMAGLPSTRRTDDVYGAIKIDVLVRDSSLIDRMVTDLTDEHHKVDTGQVKRVKGSGDERGNPWQFDATISVAHGEANQGDRRLANARKIDVKRAVDESHKSIQKRDDEVHSGERSAPLAETTSADVRKRRSAVKPTDK